MQDDPSYFTFFFDTSRRRTCYLAPERFYPSHQIKLYTDAPRQFLDISKGLTHAMDIFSLGCVLVELNSTVEEYYPFSYGELVKYKCAFSLIIKLFVFEFEFEKIFLIFRKILKLF